MSGARPALASGGTSTTETMADTRERRNAMSRKAVVVCLGLVMLAGALAPVRALAADEPMASGMKGDMLVWISDAESKLNQLADAMPESKYSWRPGKGVRSVGEVFMHVAAANIGLPSYWGVKPPAGFNFESYEKSATSKAEIKKALADSFVYVKKALMDTPESDFDKPTEFFGMKSTIRGGYLLVLSHVHEHLGQSIAYARMNGVVPPWTAKQQAEEAKSLAEKKKKEQQK
jgi:uncharacterized damage-inducible protein DinB